jgi:hypothetical protein
MPVERRSRTQQVTAVGVGVVAVLLAVGLAWGLLALASGGDGPVRLQLGDDQFNAGQAQRLSNQIGEAGPVLFSDVSGRGQRRPIIVNHFGDDPQTRWVAFSARAPGADEGCFLSWSPERELYEERAVADGAGRERGELCRDLTFPPSGEGLEQYEWTVDDDENLIIDLRSATEAEEPPS